VASGSGVAAVSSGRASSLTNTCSINVRQRLTQTPERRPVGYGATTECRSRRSPPILAVHDRPSVTRSATLSSSRSSGMQFAIRMPSGGRRRRVATECEQRAEPRRDRDLVAHAAGAVAWLALHPHRRHLLAILEPNAQDTALWDGSHHRPLHFHSPEHLRSDPGIRQHRAAGVARPLTYSQRATGERPSLDSPRRALSSVGRARPLHGRGRRFEPCSAHSRLPHHHRQPAPRG
jgi:hypothetical protein